MQALKNQKYTNRGTENLFSVQSDVLSINALDTGLCSSVSSCKLQANN